MDPLSIKQPMMQMKSPPKSTSIYREPSQRNLSQRMAESISEREFFGDTHLHYSAAFANAPSSDDPVSFHD